ncbi:MAG: hypothetical protein JW837_17780 [Sedimentisphaerales bacterium]|nr:hypothetical protein [Sedimentisphaerales bacterium]
MKQNCWEVKNCGRQEGGSKAKEKGVCLASADVSNDGKNGGKNAGRYCWKIGGTLCGGQVQGTFASKMSNCLQCEFFKKVREEEGDNFIG